MSRCAWTADLQQSLESGQRTACLSGGESTVAAGASSHGCLIERGFVRQLVWIGSEVHQEAAAEATTSKV